MGDPKKISRKYSPPSHPWQKERIDEEKDLLRDYGMKNKKEIWKMNSKLRKFKRQVKNLVPRRDKQAEVEERQLMDKLRRLNLIDENSTLEDVLGLGIKDICDRRLQTIVQKRKLSRSIKQARQLITHEHIAINGRKVTSPSYLVSVDEEGMVSFANNSSMKDEKHPERFQMGGPDLEESPVIKKKKKKEEDKKAKENKVDDKKESKEKESADKETEKKPNEGENKE